MEPLWDCTSPPWRLAMKSAMDRGWGVGVVAEAGAGKVEQPDLEGEEPRADEGDQHLGEKKVGKEAQAERAKIGEDAEATKGEDEEEAEIGNEGDEDANDVFIGRKTGAHTMDDKMSEEKESGVKAKGHGCGAFEEQAGETDDPRALAVNKAQGGEGDDEPAEPDVELPAAEGVIELQGELVQERTSEETNEDAAQAGAHGATRGMSTATSVI